MHWKSVVEFTPFGSGADDSSIATLEDAIGVSVPEEYRDFLFDDGGGYVRDGRTQCTYPTPFGKHNITVLYDIQRVMRYLDSTITPRNMICIGYGHFGMTTCLSVAGLDHGQVFALDTEMRFYWKEDTISKYPSLDTSIKKFFRLRDSSELPERPWGYENCYHIANTFSKFLAKLRSRT